MFPTDKEEFDHCMIRCFQNYRAAIDDGLLDEWFEEFGGFNFFHVRNAFKTYVRENEKFPPTLAAIIRLSKKSSREHNQKVLQERPRRCYVNSCMDNEVEECWIDTKVLICRFHMEEMILKTRPDSIDARIIRGAKEFEVNARKLGIYNYEHFRNIHTTWYKIIKRGET